MRVFLRLVSDLDPNTADAATITLNPYPIIMQAGCAITRGGGIDCVEGRLPTGGCPPLQTYKRGEEKLPH